MSEAVTINGGITVNVYPRGSMPAQQEARTLEWNDEVCDDEVTFEEAEKAVAKLGNGWRMPTRQELESCLDLNRDDPAVDPEMHPDVTSDSYWSSTPCAWSSSDHVWAVNFYDGNVYDDRRDNHARVRAVRSVSQSDAELGVNHKGTSMNTTDITLHPTMQAATRGMFGQDREPESDEAKIFRLEQELRQAKFTARCLQDKVWHLEEAASVKLPRVTFDTNKTDDPQCAETHDVGSVLIAQAVNELIKRHADELQERCEQLQRAQWAS